MSKPKSSARFRFSGAALLLVALFFLFAALKSGNPSLYLLAAAVPCVFLFFGTVLARMFSLDRMILALSLYLCAVGIASFALNDPDAAVVQSLYCCAGLVALLTGSILIRSLRPSVLTSLCTAFLGLLLLSAELFSPSLSFPLAEAAMALLLISFSSLFARQGPVSASLLGAAALILLLVSGRTADAVLWSAVVLLLFFAADGRPAVLLPSLAAVLLLFFGAFRFVPAGIHPQDTSLLKAMVSGEVGVVGSDTLPPELSSADSVSLFPRLAGNFGLVFSGLTVLLFLPLTLRGASVASSSRTRFHSVLAMSAALLTALRALAAALSLFGFVPLFAPEFPLLTSSLPDLCAELFLIGLLCGISGRNDADLAEDAHLAMLAK